MSTTTIDLDGAQLTVETQALFRAWLEKTLAGPPAAPVSKSHPAPAEGERYVGTIIRADGSGHHIYRMPLERGLSKNWHDALEHATAKGGELPDRVEAALMFATRTEGEFEDAWYWTREQPAGTDGYAWCQYFANGGQNDGHKSNGLSVVLVRRVALQ